MGAGEGGGGYPSGNFISETDRGCPVGIMGRT
jgi:hypothetical protein